MKNSENRKNDAHKMVSESKKGMKNARIRKNDARKAIKESEKGMKNARIRKNDARKAIRESKMGIKMLNEIFLFDKRKSLLYNVGNRIIITRDMSEG